MADDKQIEALTGTVAKLVAANADGAKTFKENQKEQKQLRSDAAKNLMELRRLIRNTDGTSKEGQTRLGGQEMLEKFFKNSGFQFVQDRSEGRLDQFDFANTKGRTAINQAFDTAKLESALAKVIQEAQLISDSKKEGEEFTKEEKERLDTLQQIETMTRQALDYQEQMADETALDAFKKYFGTMGDFKQFIGNLRDTRAGKQVTKITDKVKDGFAFIFDIIKFGLVLFGGLTALTGFMNGWNKAFDWFGKNASFGDMLASGLAGIVQAFTGITDDKAKGIAENAAFYINGVISFLKRIVAAFGNITGLRERQDGESFLGDAALVVGSLLFMFGPKGMIGSAISFLFKGFMALAGIIATAVGFPVAAVVGIVAAIGLVIAGIIIYWEEIQAGLSKGAQFISDMYAKYIQPIFDTIKDFFVGLANKAKEFFGGDTAELTQAIDEGLVESEGFIGIGNNKVNREMAEQASSEKLKMLLKDADLSRKDRRFVEDLLKSRDIQAAGQGGNVATANTMDETAAMKSEADANRGGGDTAIVATTNNNQSSQTTNITPGGTNTQPGASYAVTDGLPAT